MIAPSHRHNSSHNGRHSVNDHEVVTTFVVKGKASRNKERVVVIKVGRVRGSKGRTQVLFYALFTNASNEGVSDGDAVHPGDWNKQQIYVLCDDNFGGLFCGREDSLVRLGRGALWGGYIMV